MKTILTKSFAPSSQHSVEIVVSVDSDEKNLVVPSGSFRINGETYNITQDEYVPVNLDAVIFGTIVFDSSLKEARVATFAGSLGVIPDFSAMGLKVLHNLFIFESNSSPVLHLFHIVEKSASTVVTNEVEKHV